MKGIGGNTTAVIQTYTVTKNNGNQNKVWTDAVSLWGWLDLVSGDSRFNAYNAKIQESTHVFVSDFVKLPDNVTEENSRAVINGKRYDVKLIDNPMEMGSGSQLEIFLKFTGGQ